MKVYRRKKEAERKAKAFKRKGYKAFAIKLGSSWQRGRWIILKRKSKKGE